MRLLIVEDDPVGSILLQEILKYYGNVDNVTDGHEAIAAFDRAWTEGKPYDLIFMDIMLPSMDGIQVLSRIREMERERNIPYINESKIIITSSIEKSEIINKAFYEYRVKSYIVKPTSVDNIINAIKKLFPTQAHK